MIKLKPFRAVRPPKEYAEEIASRPYDVLSSAEARQEAGEKSLLHITKPEINFMPTAYEYASVTYDSGKKCFLQWIDKGWLFQDETEKYYIYAQTMDGRTQYGLTACASAEDYESGKIKKHELTREDKEKDRTRHVNEQNANIEPVFLSYPDVEEMNELVASIVETQSAEYDFTSGDGVRHQFWIVDSPEHIERITRIFENVPALYIADGHHRTAAAAAVAKSRRLENPNHRGDEEYNWFMAVIFPESHLRIFDYNRLVKDLNGLSAEQFLDRLNENFTVEKQSSSNPYKPSALHNFSMYLAGSWYSLTAKKGTYNDADPVGGLDVTVLSDLVLGKILDITDLRTSKRIDFVGGIRGLDILGKRVDSKEMAVAFALYPVSMRQLINIADAGEIMPPKTTWFEPKLRSGLAIHLLVDNFKQLFTFNPFNPFFLK
ncbi:MAG: DUF1015 family protein [Prevotellaceae bacterium]|jgi:uncharacterized protein (DUF1015 family)|nr:DUF1015 family protein [Prevotellaceae bacterium]